MYVLEVFLGGFSGRVFWEVFMGVFFEFFLGGFFLSFFKVKG